MPTIDEIRVNTELSVLTRYNIHEGCDEIMFYDKVKNKNVTMSFTDEHKSMNVEEYRSKVINHVTKEIEQS